MMQNLYRTDPYYFSFLSQPANVPPIANAKYTIKNMANNNANIYVDLSTITFRQSDIE